MLSLINENEVIKFAHDITLSIQNKNWFYVGILLNISPIENVLKNIELC